MSVAGPAIPGEAVSGSRTGSHFVTAPTINDPRRLAGEELRARLGAFGMNSATGLDQTPLERRVTLANGGVVIVTKGFNAERPRSHVSPIAANSDQGVYYALGDRLHIDTMGTFHVFDGDAEILPRLPQNPSDIEHALPAGVAHGFELGGLDLTRRIFVNGDGMRGLNRSTETAGVGEVVLQFDVTNRKRSRFDGRIHTPLRASHAGLWDVRSGAASAMVQPTQAVLHDVSSGSAVEFVTTPGRAGSATESRNTSTIATCDAHGSVYRPDYGRFEIPLKVEPGETTTITIRGHMTAEITPEMRRQILSLDPTLPRGEMRRANERAVRANADGVAPSVRTANAEFDRHLHYSDGVVSAATLRYVDGTVGMRTGAPWYMNGFGRDEIVALRFLSLTRPELLRDHLKTLHRNRATPETTTDVHAYGRLPHEWRLPYGRADLGEAGSFYDAIDVTIESVSVAEEIWRRGSYSNDEMREMLPELERTMEWIANHSREDDGFVRYATVDGEQKILTWKDNAVTFRMANGDYPTAPFAATEAIAHQYAAYRSMASIYRDLAVMEADDRQREDYMDHSVSYAQKATRLQDQFEAKCMVTNRPGYPAYPAMGIDGEGRQVDALGDDVAFALDAGLVKAKYVKGVVDLMMDTNRLNSGWGIRTMSKGEAAYDPTSVQNGAVWQHQTARAARALARNGFHDEARTYYEAMANLFIACEGKVGEMREGIDREVTMSDGSTRHRVPKAHGGACDPQLWTDAAAEGMLMQSLGLHVDAPNRMLLVNNPHVPKSLGGVWFDNVELFGNPVSVRANEHGISIDGLPDDVLVLKGAAVEQRAPEALYTESAGVRGAVHVLHGRRSLGEHLEQLHGPRASETLAGLRKKCIERSDVTRTIDLNGPGGGTGIEPPTLTPHS